MAEPGPVFVRLLELAKCVVVVRVLEHARHVEARSAAGTHVCVEAKSDVCVCVCIMFIDVYIYIYVYTHTHTHTHTHRFIYIYIHVYVGMPLLQGSRVVVGGVWTCHVLACAWFWLVKVYVYMYVCVYVCMCT